MPRKLLFADSGFFIGLWADTDDDHKQAAHDIFEHLKNMHLISDFNDLCITNLIIAEVLHGLTDKQFSFNGLIETYEKLKQCKIYNIRQNHIEEAISNKLRFRSGKSSIGFVDATSLVIMDRLNIGCIISFDSDFDNLADYYTRICDTDAIDQYILRLRH